MGNDCGDDDGSSWIAMSMKIDDEWWWIMIRDNDGGWWWI